MSTPLNTIYSYFETGDFPTQEQFQASWSSFWHKDESISTNKIAGLDSQLQNKADKNIFETHVSNPDSHANYLAKKDASNLDNANVQAWKVTLGVGELPENIATVDNGDKFGNVYSKDQSNDRFLTFNDYVNEDGEILAERIEALGLTTLIEASENSISEFTSHSGSYEFEDNDFIAIPDNNGNFSLYMFKGGEKTDKGNYLPTGISNVTIGMVEGLQAALNEKMNKPSGNGSFFIRGLGPGPVYASISPAANYLLSWDGSDFKESNVYYNAGKLGVGTTSPTEMFHLNNGRIRSKAVVLDENEETLINQITCFARKLNFTDSTGTKKTVLTVEDLPFEFLRLPSKLTQAQKEQFGIDWNNQYSNGNLNVYSITPTVMKNDHVVRYLVLQGLNLNVNPAATSVKFIPVGNVIGAGEIDCLGFQTFANGQSMIVSIYGDALQPNTQYNLMIRTSTPTIQTHRTASSINVVENINNIDLSALQWDTKAYTPGQEGTVFTTNGGMFAYNSSTSNKAYAYEPNVYVAAAKSSVIFELNSNFYLEMNISVSLVGGGMDNTNDFYGYLGLLQNNIPLALTDNSFLRTIMSSFRSGGYQSAIVWNNMLSIPTKIEPISTILNANVIIMRQGNIYTQFLTVGNTTIIQSVTSTTEAISLSLAVSNGTTQKTISGSIVQAFTF